MRNRTLLIVTLVAVAIASGSVFLYVESLNGTKDILILDFINGKIILDAEDRELLKQRVINITLENEQVKALTAGKNFTTYVTLTKSIQEIEETNNDSGRRIYIEFDYVAVVTLAFEDGSGYKIPVNWEEWTVGEPEYSEQVSPPDSIIRIGPSETRERRGT
jgi:hypothetical protein